MKLLLTLVSDKGELVSQREVLDVPDEDSSLWLEVLTKLDESLRHHAATIQPEKHGAS
jgi:hypothetical protein